MRVATLALFAMLAQPLSVIGVRPQSHLTANLVLPHELREGETAWLVVTVGVIPRGAEIEVTTPSGRPLGVISPHGIRAGHEAGTYTIPLPADAISGRRVCVRLSLEFNGKQRAPTKKEVKKVRVTIRSTNASAFNGARSSM